MFQDLTTDSSIANEEDRLGGNGGPLESGIYLAKIKAAYGEVSKGGARGLSLQLDIDGREYRETLWVTSGTAKGCKNYYEKDGEKHYLPGFLNATALALLTVGKELAELEPEDKVLNLYDFDQKTEVPTKVPMLTELLGEQVYVGIRKVKDNKSVRGDNGYVPTNEAREFNEMDKFFHAESKMTTSEIRAEAEEAHFFDLWDEKNTGKLVDKFKEVDGAPAAGAPSVGKPKSERKALFGKQAS